MPRAAGERRRLALSFTYFALLLASYYLIRPVRDALAAGSGAASIKYLASVVFVAMLLLVPVFGWLVARVRRARLLPAIYFFFIVNLLLFAAAFQAAPDDVWIGRAFYVWTTVFNLFVVSVFWSFMADLWAEEQGRRMFGVIAAGGSLGGLVGPLIARSLAGALGSAGLALVAAVLLAGALAMLSLLLRDAGSASRGADRLGFAEPVGGQILAGLTRLVASPYLLGIATLVGLGSLLGMFVYIELAGAVANGVATSAARTAFYAQRDLWVNGAAFALQLLAVGTLAQRGGVRPLLSGAGALALCTFLALVLLPAVGTLVLVNVVLRVTEFGIAKPGRDMLYTVVDTESQYKVKNVIDTVVYRASDAVSSWLHAALTALGLSLAGIALAGAVAAATLAMIAYAVATGYRRRGGR